MEPKKTRRAFTVSSVVIIAACVVAGAMSVINGEWLTLAWQFIAAVGFACAMMQERRANLTEEQ